MKNKWSLKLCIPLIFLCSALLLVAMCLGTFYVYQQSQFRQNSMRRLERMSPRLVFITQSLLSTEQDHVLDLEMMSMKGLPHVHLVVVLDKDNKVLHSNDSTLAGVALEATELAEAVELIGVPSQRIRWQDEQTRVIGVFPYTLLNTPAPVGEQLGGHVAISVDLSEPYKALRKSLWLQALVFSILLIIVAGILWFIVRRMLTEPLHKIVAVTRAMSDGDFTVRTGLDTRNELGEIASTLDLLAELNLKQAEVVSSNMRLSHIVEEMVDEVYLHNTETFEVISTNKATRENLGYSVEEMARLKPWDFVEGHSRLSTAEFLQPLFEGKVSHLECESRHIRKDGSTYPVRACMQYMSCQSPPVLVCIAQDLSEQEIQEEITQLRDRALAEVNEGIVITDARQSDRIIVYANQAVCDMSGFSVGELLGNSTDILRRGKMTQPVLETINDACKKGESIQVQMEATRKDGSDYVTELSMSPLFSSTGVLTHYIGISRDITQKLQTEEKLHQAQKIKAIGDLSGGLAHDFNNLLSVIVGNLELLRATTKDETQIARIAGAVNAAHMGARLTHRLLSFASQQRLAPVVANVNDHISNAMMLLGSTIGEAICLTEDLAPDLWHTLADPGEIETAIINLTINARDAMLQGGLITVRTANVILRPEDMEPSLELEPGEYVSICVIDDGPGISESLLDRIFEPFFTTKKDHAGSGLGLASVFGFAKQSGGGVHLKSVEGEGASVTVYLPRHVRKSEDIRKSVSTIEEPCRCFTGASILVVEDKMVVRQLTVLQLETFGFNTLEVENGVKAIELLESGVEVDVVLSDVIMPGGVCGYDVARWVRANRPGCHMLLSSGFNQTIDREEVLDIVVLHKPYRLDDLRKALHDLMSCDEGE